MSDRARDPGDLSPREAWHRYVNHRKLDSTAESVQNYHYRIKLFVEWCEGQDIRRVDDLTGWDLDTYENLRQGTIAPVTLYGEMKDLRNWFRYLARIEAVDGDFPDKVHVPEIDDADKSSNILLEPDDALELLVDYRATPAVYGSRFHAWLEVMWHTGARLSGLRALDIRDYDREDAFLEFHHRPETGTPLKNKNDGERPVGLPKQVVDVVDRYIEHNRYEVHDDEGREPLFASSRGRFGKTTGRNWTYMATFPCHHTDCPHGKDPETCEFKSYHGGSKCPSSRSPHQVRKGSITWQRDLGFPPDVVAERVNASIEVIEQYYDQATARERMERRRRQYVDKMEVDP